MARRRNGTTVGEKTEEAHAAAAGNDRLLAVVASCSLASRFGAFSNYRSDPPFQVPLESLTVSSILPLSPDYFGPATIACKGELSLLSMVFFLASPHVRDWLGMSD